MLQRFLVVGLLLCAMFGCASTDLTVDKGVSPGHVRVLSVRGARVVIRNTGEAVLEVRRRAPTGEAVGVSALPPGSVSEFEAPTVRSVEILNRDARQGSFEVEVSEGEGNGVIALKERAI